MALGKNVKALREQRGWTLKDLSERSAVPVGTISAIENRNSVRSEYASKLASAFGVSTDELTGDETMTATTPTSMPNQATAPVVRAQAAINSIDEFPDMGANAVYYVE